MPNRLPGGECLLYMVHVPPPSSWTAASPGFFSLPPSLLPGSQTLIAGPTDQGGGGLSYLTMYNKTKAYRKRHRELGLCTRCPRPAEPGHVQCQYHIQYEADSNWRWRRDHLDHYRHYEKDRSVIKRQARKDNNQCIRCGIPLRDDMDAGRVKCLNCREEVSCS